GTELDLLRGLVDGVAAGRGGSALVEGEPGIGKSALVRAGLAGAEVTGCQVFWCLADVALQRVPLRVLLDGLGVDAGELSSDQLVPGLGGPLNPVAAMAERLLTRVDRLSATAPVVMV